jgi:hypothetical protein
MSRISRNKMAHELDALNAFVMSTRSMTTTELEAECRKRELLEPPGTEPGPSLPREQYIRVLILDKVNEIRRELRKDQCDECGGKLEFKASIPAPGYGQSWGCVECKRRFVKIGTNLTPCHEFDLRAFGASDHSW